MDKETEEVNDCPVEQVRLTIPTSDDPTLGCLTFRTWVLGVTSCAILAFTSQFFAYRQTGVSISTFVPQMIALPIGKLMAAKLPTKPVRIPATNWSFSMNPGPFNMKEHALITIFASSGSSGLVYGVDIFTISKVYYHRNINLFPAFLLCLTTQFLGYGWAGLFRKFLVDNPYMWWPSMLAQVSLFRTMHEKEVRAKGRITRLQFFTIAVISSFAYYIIPGYFFPSIGTLSFACWIWKESVLAQQIGSGAYGFGLGSISFDWTMISSMFEGPLVSPAHAIFNNLAGMILTLYILPSIGYWNNLYGSKRFPLLSSNLFTADGKPYDVSRILDQKTLELDLEKYNNYSPIHMSIYGIVSFGSEFASIAATLSHVALFHGRTIWRQARESMPAEMGDVHTRIMKKNYDSVPQWWFYAILIPMLALSILTCEGFGKQFQISYWGILLACALTILLTIPFGVIQATTNQLLPFGTLVELVMGYISPKPLLVLTFKSYVSMNVYQALSFIQDLKFGHYMKIPPKSMFVAQLASTLVSTIVFFTTAWLLLTTVPNICDPTKLPLGSPWTCPLETYRFNVNSIMGGVGPLHIFGHLGQYSMLNWCILLGLLSPVPVWVLARMYPEKKWIRLIYMPLCLSSLGPIPPARSVCIWFGTPVALFFNIYVYRNFKGWWAKYTYLLSIGLDVGIAITAILCFLALQMKDNVYGINWWGLDINDHCPLAQCPTAPGIHVDGCPLH